MVDRIETKKENIIKDIHEDWNIALRVNNDYQSAKICQFKEIIDVLKKEDIRGINYILNGFIRSYQKFIKEIDNFIKEYEDVKEQYGETDGQFEQMYQSKKEEIEVLTFLVEYVKTVLYRVNE